MQKKKPRRNFWTKQKRNIVHNEMLGCQCFQMTLHSTVRPFTFPLEGWRNQNYWKLIMLMLLLLKTREKRNSPNVVQNKKPSK